MRIKKLCFNFALMIFVLCVLFNAATPSRADVIIDNGTAGTSYTGSWSLSGGTTPYGASSLWSRNGATYTFSMTGQQAGTYEVSMWWSGWSSRPPSVPVAVNYTGGTKNLTVNQLQNAGQWNSLGTYYFNGTGSVTITAANGDTLSTCADAVQFRYVSSAQPPTATIDSISPSPAKSGESVTFSGHGTDIDGTIVGYTWTSSRDGTLSSAKSFTTSSLSTGTHTITFTVTDDSGLTSSGVTATLIVGDASEEVIIDNTDSRTSRTGTWSASTADGYYGTGSVWSRDGATFTWKFTPTQTGTYDVAMWWTTTTTRSSSIPVTVQSAGDSKVVTIDQLQNAGKWNSLGTFSFVAGTTYSITLTSQPAPTSTCADAVKFTFISANDALDTIIDNTDSRTSRTGTWSTSSASGYYGTGSIWARDGATFTWKFTPPDSGYYQLSMWWTTSASRSSSIPVTINYSGGSQIVYINQLQNASKWNNLGTYYFKAGTTYNINITAQPDPTSTCADAVRLTRTTSAGPAADFTGDPVQGSAPLTVQFTDRSIGMMTAWSWDFGDGGTSTQRNPSHTYTSSGYYTVSLTVSGAGGSNTKTRSQYIIVSSSGTEHIYVADGYASDGTFLNNVLIVLKDMGATGSGDTWYYTNSKGKNFVIHIIDTTDAFMTALKTDNAHIIFNGHSNYGLGGTFYRGSEILDQVIDDIYYIDDARFTHVSTPMVSVNISALQTHQAYPNWRPVFRDGTNGVMPHTFSEGTPPYNYYITYQLPGDPTYYRVELADGSYLQRFPDSGVPAWYSASGLAPDPAKDKKYFITNSSTSTDPYKPHFGSKTIVYGNKDFDQSELKYSRMFYAACNSCNYYAGNFNRGILYCTTSDSEMYTAVNYLQDYLKGMSDEAIVKDLNIYQDIHEMINFNLKPPSLR
jgi:PKD repeat protein